MNQDHFVHHGLYAGFMAWILLFAHMRILHASGVNHQSHCYCSISQRRAWIDDIIQC